MFSLKIQFLIIKNSFSQMRYCLIKIYKINLFYQKEKTVLIKINQYSKNISIKITYNFLKKLQ